MYCGYMPTHSTTRRHSSPTYQTCVAERRSSLLSRVYVNSRETYASLGLVPWSQSLATFLPHERSPSYWRTLRRGQASSTVSRQACTFSLGLTVLSRCRASLRPLNERIWNLSDNTIRPTMHTCGIQSSSSDRSHRMHIAIHALAESMCVRSDLIHHTICHRD